MNPKNKNFALTSPPNQQSKSRKPLIAIVITLFILAGLGAYFYHDHQQKEQAYQADKDRFAQIETDMKTAYDAMVAAAGVPDVSKQTKTCSHVSLKFKQGRLNCGVSYEFGYPISSYSDAINLTSKLKTAVISTPTFSSKNSVLENDRLDANNQTQSDVTIPFATKSRSSCDIYFSLINPGSDQFYDSINSAHVAKYIFGCSSDMDMPIYPLAI